MTLKHLPKKVATCRIRPCKDSDWPLLEAIFREHEGVTFAAGELEEFSAAIRMPNYLVAEAGSEIVGGGGVRILQTNSGYVASLFAAITKKDRQGMGIGAALFLSRLALLPAEAKEWAICVNSNSATMPFHERVGFTWFIRRVHVQARAEMATMTLQLLPADLRKIQALLRRNQVELPDIEFPVGAPDENLPSKFQRLDPAWIEEPLAGADRIRLCRRLLVLAGLHLPAGVVFAGALYMCVGALAEPWDRLASLLRLFYIGAAGVIFWILWNPWKQIAFETLGLIRAIRNGSRFSLEIVAKRFALYLDGSDSRPLLLAFELPENRILLLRQEKLRVYNNFPSAKFSITQIRTRDGTEVYTAFQGLSELRKPAAMIRILATRADQFPEALSLYEGRWEEIIANLDLLSMASPPQASS